LLIDHNKKALISLRLFVITNTRIKLSKHYSRLRDEGLYVL